MAKQFPRSPAETFTKSPQSHSDGNRMHPVTPKFPENRNWRELYKAAICELDSTKVPDRIAETKKVLVQRARELFQKTGDNLEKEQALPCTCFIAR